MTFANVFLVLFLIIDPIGSVAMCHKMLAPYEAKKRNYILLREMLIALSAMILVYLVGDWLLQFLGISQIAVRISSGMILFIAAIKILFTSMGEYRNLYRTNEEPFIIPLAIPLISGPSLLATVMLFSSIDQMQPFLLMAILAAWALSLIILYLSPLLHRVLGDNGLMACEKVMGMVLILLALQRFLEGVRLLMQSLN
ncbi:MAG: NAAT family transporter YhgN [Chlamydiales bacterium]